MTSPSKRKGDEAERECQDLLRELLSMPHIRRALGAGRKDDVGDIDGVPETAIQVAWREDLAATIREKLPEVERQRQHRRVLFSAVFIRRSRSKEKWIVVMSPAMFARLLKWALYGRKAHRGNLPVRQR